MQVSKFKQAYEERKKVLQLGEQNGLLMRPPMAVPWPMQFAYTFCRRLGRVRLAPFSPSETSPRCVLTPRRTVITSRWTHTMAQLFAQAALEASHGAGRATLGSVATQALNAQHGEPSAASAAAPKGEIVKGAIGPTAAASPRASRYDGGSIQDRQSMFGGARRASLSATSVLGCDAAPPAAAAFAACAPVSETDVVDEQGATQNALRKTSGRGLKSRGGATSPKAAKPSRPSARKIHRACGNVVPEAL